MKHTVKHRMIAAMLVAFATIVFASNTFAALNAYLTLKDKKTQKGYKADMHQDGTFSFSNVPAGTYSLVYVVDGGSGAGSPPSTIEIESFSWGATNSGTMSSGSGASGRASSSMTTSKTSPVTRSNISNNRVTSPSNASVSVGDLDGDGIPDVIVSPITVSISNADGSRGLASSTVILDNVTITAVCSPTGKYKGNWDLKQNTK